MLPSATAEVDFVGLVDLSRPRAWLFPGAEYRTRAQAASGGRYHLDWIVVPISNTCAKVEPEEAFEEFRLPS